MVGRLDFAVFPRRPPHSFRAGAHCRPVKSAAGALQRTDRNTGRLFRPLRPLKGKKTGESPLSLPKAFVFIKSLFAAFPVRAGFSFKPFFPPFRQYRHGAGTRPEKPSNAFPENVLYRRRTRFYAGLWRVVPAFLRPCGSVSKHVTSSQAASGRAADPFTAGALPGRRVREGFPPFADNTKEP